MVGTMRGTEEQAGPATRQEDRPAGRRAGGRAGHHRANIGSWIAVSLIIVGFAVGVFALASHSMALWIVTGVALVAGGAIALASRIMDQAY